MPLTDMRKKSSRWVVVINNPVASDEEALGRARQQGWTAHGQKEVGKKTGTPHYQIYLKTPHIRASQVKKIFTRGYIDISNGTDEHNLDYVTKEDTRVGDLPSTSYVNQHQFFDLVWAYLRDQQGCEFKETYAPLRPTCKTQPEYNAHIEYTPDNTRIERSDDALLARLYDHACHWLIQQGHIIESIAVNPQTLSAWKRYSLSILYRSSRRQTDRQTAEISVPIYDITNDRNERTPTQGGEVRTQGSSIASNEEGSRCGNQEGYCSSGGD